MAKRMIGPLVWSIYRITNTKNGKSYVGVTSYFVEFRWQAHVRDSDKAPKRGIKDRFLWMAIRKHGRDAFTVETLSVVNTRKEAMKEEMQFIAKFNSRAPGGYNMTIGGEGVLPRPPITEETRERLRISHTGKKDSEETRRKKALAGRRPHTENELRNLVAGRKTSLSPAHRQKIGDAQRGQKRGPHSEQTRKKIHEAAIRDGRRPPSRVGFIHSPESRLKIGLAGQGRVASAETRRKRSLAVSKARGGDPGTHLPGTSWSKGRQKWSAEIMVNRKRKHIGYFATAEEAHAAYLAHITLSEHLAEAEVSVSEQTAGEPRSPGMTAPIPVPMSVDAVPS